MPLRALFLLLLGGEPAHARTKNLSTPAFCTAITGYRLYDTNLQRFLNRDPIQERKGLNLKVSIVRTDTDRGIWQNPVGVCRMLGTLTQGSSSLATLGFGTIPCWGIHAAWKRI